MSTPRNHDDLRQIVTKCRRFVGVGHELLDLIDAVLTSIPTEATAPPVANEVERAAARKVMQQLGVLRKP